MSIDDDKNKTNRFIRLLCVTIVTLGLVLVVLSCEGIRVSSYFTRGAIASVSPLASDVGRQVFKKGGNAFDVAVATALTLAVVHPQAGNLGGGGFALIRDGQTGDIRALDFREKAPAAAFEKMYQDSTGTVIEGLSTKGALSSGVPGTVAGLYKLWETYGSLPWNDLVLYAARFAETGFEVDEILANDFISYADALSAFTETSDLFLPDGRPLKAGERFVQPELASVLYQIAAEGAETFYRGNIADLIVDGLGAHGGIITHEDLESYNVRWLDPIHFKFDSLDIYSMPPPSSGGIIMGQILKLIEPFDFSKYNADSPEYIHLFTEASRLAFADRSAHLGDPDFWKIPSGMLDEKYINFRRQKIAIERAGQSEEIQPGNPSAVESDETTHLSVCDNDGNMVSITTTLNATFGSKLVVSGAGFLMNNEMDDFSIRPGYPNIWGLIGGEANKIEPAKRMLSSMSPTLVLQNKRPRLITGSSGGSKIITTVAQNIINLFRFRMTPQESVLKARFHHQWIPDLLYFEKGAFSSEQVDALKGLSHILKERSLYGDLHIITIDDNGFMQAASDSRRGGATAGY